MAPALDFLKQMGEHLHILAYAEECGFGIVLVKHVKYPWRNLRPGAIIKSEENSLFFVGKIPDESGEEFSDDFWRFDSHIWDVYVGKNNNKKLPLRNIFQLMRSIGLLLKTALLAFCFSLLYGCGNSDVIKEDKMVDLLVDMFLADQAIDVKPQLLIQKDSMMVYPPIMEKHGVTIEQYEASMKHYLDDGESYIDILKEVKKVLNAREKEISALLKKDVEERDSRILTEWWALDSVRCMTGAELRYNSYLRSVRWMVMYNEPLGSWKVTDSLMLDIPQNAQWWTNNIVPAQRKFLEHFLKDVEKVEPKHDRIMEQEKDILKEQVKNEKVSRKLLDNTKRKRSGIKEGVRPLELK